MNKHHPVQFPVKYVTDCLTYSTIVRLTQNYCDTEIPFITVSLLSSQDSEIPERSLCIIIMPPYANKINCAVVLVKCKYTGWDSLHYMYLAFEPTVQALSTQWADRRVTFPKVDCCRG